MAEVKGTVINAWKKFLAERYGEEPLNSAIQSLEAKERLRLQSPILDSTWYPIDVQQALSRVTRSLAKPTENDMATELGRFMADYVYTRVYSVLLKNKPGKDKPLDWFDDVVYRGLRTYVVEMTGPNSSVARYSYIEGKPTPGQCRTLQAFIARKMELAGYQGVSCVHQKCLAKGHDSCDFLMQWTAAS